VLGDPKRRKQYDRDGASGGFSLEAAGGLAGIHVRFHSRHAGEAEIGEADSIGARRRATRGRDRDVRLELSLEDAARGGRRWVRLADGPAYEVDIPAGVEEGRTIRLSGEGEEGAHGGPSGDLVLRIKLRPHPRFTLDGHDLHVDVPVTPWEAALGAELAVPTLDGLARVAVPAGSSSGRTVRVRRHGYPWPGGGRGDLYATLRIAVPERLSDRERELFEQLAEASRFDPRRDA
jgi:curved DNA-binding protein